MGNRYQDIYPSSPILDSGALLRPSAADLLTLEYFEAPPGQMPEKIFDQHHVLINLRDAPMRVENFRDGEHIDFIYKKDEIVVTPAGIRSGWKWHETSKEIGSDVLFESLARVFLVKLIQKYGDRPEEELRFARGFTSAHYKGVLDYVAAHFSEAISVEDLAKQAALSPSHFSRLFKQTIGQSPMQFVMSYRVEQAKKQLSEKELPLIDIALSCGFSDQAHFSRVFKQFQGVTPSAFRKSTS
ncbi:MAG: AraC family transcriptional regulator [Desulfobacteraceae bacterium]|nr:MAG: AraC family transcriptional regulator [Desulfobacteraceae bacterium]